MTTNINEILNDNELEQIAGGSSKEIFENLGYLNEHCGITFSGDYDAAVKFLTENFAKAGIKFKAQEKQLNEYYDAKTGEALGQYGALLTLHDYLNKQKGGK